MALKTSSVSCEVAQDSLLIIQLNFAYYICCFHGCKKLYDLVSMKLFVALQLYLIVLFGNNTKVKESKMKYICYLHYFHGNK